MNGLLLVDKPLGWTSFDAVNYVRKLVAQAEGKKPKHVKVGHTGTLDPLATGLLVLLIGKNYTRRAADFSKRDKTYEVVARLGQTSTTGDEEGVKTDGADIVPDEPTVARAFGQFVGMVSQLPPQYSAIKINGQRAYDLARQGKTAELQPRQVRIDRMELRDYTYPLVSFVCDVSSGTYIRSLVADVGAALGTGAYTTQLRRTRVGHFTVDDAVDVRSLDAESLATRLQQL